MQIEDELFLDCERGPWLSEAGQDFYCKGGCRPVLANSVMQLMLLEGQGTIFCLSCHGHHVHA